MPKNPKAKGRPAQSAIKSPGSPRAGDIRTAYAPGASAEGEWPVISFAWADREYVGKWGWPEGPEALLITNFLCDIATTSWRELTMQKSGGQDAHFKHHYMDIGILAKEAQKRLVQRRHDQRFGPDIFRFRLGATARLWGFRQGATFHVVWWDADHAVYPT